MRSFISTCLVLLLSVTTVWPVSPPKLDTPGTERTGTIVATPATPCPSIAISRTPQRQGRTASVKISMQGAPFLMFGFDFLIGYDAHAIALLEVKPGSLVTSCDWEYFTYRIGGGYPPDSAYPTGLVRVISIADLSTGDLPSCWGPTTADTVVLTELRFMVSIADELACAFSQIRFYWATCGDNSVSNFQSDTLFVSNEVYNYGDPAPISDWNAQLPSFLGLPDTCLLSGSPGHSIVNRCLDFYNGGVDFLCTDSAPGPRGDMNLNGFVYEVSDVVLYANYFVYGTSILPPYPDVVIAESDVNRDGRGLTVADMVCLLRIIIGDLPIPKVSPVGGISSFTNDILSVTGAEAAGLRAVFEGNVTPILLTDRMNMKYAFDGRQTHVVAYAKFENVPRVQGVFGDILRADGKLVDLEIVDVNGHPVASFLTPSTFELEQNYPNPFNPTTQIEFSVPRACRVTIEVFNVSGQRVGIVHDRMVEAGTHQVTWDGKDKSGRPAASGVYFYRLRTDDYSQTRKMMLVK